MKTTITTLILLLIIACLACVAYADCDRIQPATYSPTFTSTSPDNSCGWGDTFYAAYVTTPYTGETANCSSGGDSDGQAWTSISMRTVCPKGMLSNTSVAEFNNVSVGDYMLVSLSAFGPTTHNTMSVIQYSADCTSNPLGNNHQIWYRSYNCAN